MASTRFLSDISLTAEARHVVQLAFSSALRKLDLVDRSDPICDLIAKKMIELHKRGVTDAVALTEVTMREIGAPK